jgi:tetratricopeptide (TPR) repeat protein
MPRFLCWRSVVLGLMVWPPALAQSAPQTPVPSARSGSSPVSSQASSRAPDPAADLRAEEELQKGTALTRRGDFEEAIPHLTAARGKVANEYAASFNLALCAVGTRRYSQAIGILNDLRSQGRDRAEVENLLAQAQVGNGQAGEAWIAFERAAAMSPQNEKLYLLVAEASVQQGEFSLGLKVVDAGLARLPQSARLHYQRALLLSDMDQFDRARADFALAGKLGQGSEMGYVAAAHEALLGGNVAQAVEAARAGIGQGFAGPVLLTILAEALLRAGAAPGEPAFQEAQTALEKAVAGHESDPAAHIDLGKVYLAEGRIDEAIGQLERAQQIEPGQSAVYASLAKAYQRRGDAGKAQAALAALENLNQAQAERIRSAPGDRKLGYDGGDPGQSRPSPQP